MKGLAGNQTRGIITGSHLDVVDNTGAKVISVIAVPNYHGVHGRCPALKPWPCSSSSFCS